MIIRTGSLFAAVALLLAPSAQSAESTSSRRVERNLKPSHVHASYRFDPQSDRVIYGGYGYAAAITADSSALRTEESAEARALYARPLVGTRPEYVLFREKAGNIVRFEVSPSGRIAVLSVLWGSHEELSSRSPVVLRILDASGNPILPPVASVRDFVWDPAGRRIAYTTGDPDHSKDDYRMTGTWVLDVKTGDTNRVLDTGRHVAWAEFDGGLYILAVPDSVLEQPTVWRYDPETGIAEEVDSRGIHFSPSGHFNFKKTTTNAPGFGLYESTTHRALIAEPGASAEDGALSGLLPQIVRWLPDRDVLVFESSSYEEPNADQRSHTMLYDPRSDVVIDLGETAIIGFDRAGQAVQWHRGTFERVSPEELLARPRWRGLR
jgi:hypothetical protein